QKQRKGLHRGISIHDHAPETALRVRGDPLFETDQVIYNIYDRSPERTLFPLARSKPLGVIGRVPFDEGALTGQIRADTAFPAGDWRAEDFSGERRAEAERRGRGLGRLAGDGVQTLGGVAVGVCFLLTPVFDGNPRYRW